MSPGALVLAVAAACGTPAVARETAAPAVVREVVPAAVHDRWLAEDKLRHFALSFAATGMAYGGGRLALEPDRARGAAVGLALLLGVGKELADAGRGDPFSLKDLAWDAAGVALGYFFAQRIH